MPPDASPRPSVDELFNLALIKIGARLWDFERRTDRAAERSGLLASMRDLERAERRLSAQVAGGNPLAAPALANVSAAIKSLCEVTEQLPDPRKRMALAIVMQTYCLLCRDMGHRPVMSDEGPDVRRMALVLAGMGLPRSIERVRGALTDAAAAVSRDEILAGAIDFAADVRLFMVTQVHGVDWHVPGLTFGPDQGQNST